MRRSRFFPPLLWLLCLGFITAPLHASPTAASGRNDLLEKYRQIEAELANNAFHSPVYLESEEGRGYMRGDVFAVLDHDFGQVRPVLARADSWCEIAPLHLNVKACVKRSGDEGKGLTLYVGRKFYQAPKDTYQFDYDYRVAVANDHYLAVELTAPSGPLGTKDYRMVLEATPLGAGKTLVKLSYAYKFGLLARIGMGTYFDTLGRGKIGFAKVEDEDTGELVYTTGSRGAIERNAMRYYLAVQTFLDTLELPPGRRLDARLNHWFDLTERYAAQLHEVSKGDYLRDKHKERMDQMRLQARVDGAGKRATAPAIFATP